MPITRKIIKLGDSRSISLPKSWLDYHEKQTGEEIREVAIEVDDCLKVTPIFSKRVKK